MTVLDDDGDKRMPRPQMGRIPTVKVHSLVSSAAVQLPPVPSLLPSFPQARCFYLFFLTTFHAIAFSKVTFTPLVIGALYVNALTIPIARSPLREFP